MGSPLRWSELSSAAMHLKETAMTIPGTNEVSIGRPRYRFFYARTIENRADEISGVPELLVKVHTV